MYKKSRSINFVAMPVYLRNLLLYPCRIMTSQRTRSVTEAIFSGTRPTSEVGYPGQSRDVDCFYIDCTPIDWISVYSFRRTLRRYWKMVPRESMEETKLEKKRVKNKTAYVCNHRNFNEKDRRKKLNVAVTFTQKIVILIPKMRSVFPK